MHQQQQGAGGEEEFVLGAGISDTEASTQKWAATIAFMALQTTNYNVTTAQVGVCKALCVSPPTCITPSA